MVSLKNDSKTSIAMSDGDEKLKAIATKICPSADENGIAIALHELGLIWQISEMFHLFDQLISSNRFNVYFTHMPSLFPETGTINGFDWYLPECQDRKKHLGSDTHQKNKTWSDGPHILTALRFSAWMTEDTYLFLVFQTSYWNNQNSIFAFVWILSGTSQNH